MLLDSEWERNNTNPTTTPPTPPPTIFSAVTSPNVEIGPQNVLVLPSTNPKLFNLS